MDVKYRQIRALAVRVSRYKAVTFVIKVQKMIRSYHPPALATSRASPHLRRKQTAPRILEF